jgi:hypothetical protein
MRSNVHPGFARSLILRAALAPLRIAVPASATSRSDVRYSTSARSNVGGAKLTVGRRSARLRRTQRRVAGNGVPATEVRGRGFRLKTDDRHGRDRRKVLRIDELEKMLCEARKFGVELPMDARREKREPLEQPLDVGIGAIESAQAESSGDLRILLRELRPHPAQELELAAVELQESVIHQVGAPPRSSSTLHWPVSRSTVVLR